jgi:hypothetical protein
MEALGPGSEAPTLLTYLVVSISQARTVAARYPFLCIFIPYTTLVC